MTYLLLEDYDCMSHQDGQRIFDYIKRYLEKGEIVRLNFCQVSIINPPFINKLLTLVIEEFGLEKIEYIDFYELSSLGVRILKRCKENLNHCHTDNAFKEAVDEALLLENNENEYYIEKEERQVKGKITSISIKEPIQIEE